MVRKLVFIGLKIREERIAKLFKRLARDDWLLKSEEQPEAFLHKGRFYRKGCGVLERIRV